MEKVVRRVEHFQLKRTAIVYASTLSRGEKEKKHSVDIDEDTTVGDLVQQEADNKIVNTTSSNSLLWLFTKQYPSFTTNLLEPLDKLLKETKKFLSMDNSERMPH